MFELNNFVTAGRFFLIISGELILIFIAVSFIIALLQEYLPPSRIRDFLSNRFRWVQYVFGAGLGALTPFCSCSTVPITAGLLKGGVPFGPTMAFLFSSPVLNPVIVALLLSLLGYKVTVVYVVVTFFGAMITAALLSRLGMERQVKPLMNFQTSYCAEETHHVPPLNAEPVAACCCSSGISRPVVIETPSPSLQTPGCCCSEGTEETAAKPVQRSCCTADPDVHGDIVEEERVPFREKMKRASRSAVVTFKGVFWYLLLGAAIGSFIYGFVPQDLVVSMAGPDNPWSIPVAAALGVPMYIRSETIIPISAALVGKGMGVGTVLALIIGGAGASIPELILLGSMFRKKLVIAFALNVFLVAIVAGYLVDLLM